MSRELTFGFGKYAGRPLTEVDSSYLRWALRACSNLGVQLAAEARAELRRRRKALGKLPVRTPHHPTEVDKIGANAVWVADQLGSLGDEIEANEADRGRTLEVLGRLEKMLREAGAARVKADAERGDGARDAPAPAPAQMSVQARELRITADPGVLASGVMGVGIVVGDPIVAQQHRR